jgi:hypothetical protein
MTLAVSNQPTQTAELRLRCSGIVDAAPNDVWDCAGSSGDLLLPSPPAEKATARQDQAGKASTSDGAGNGKKCVGPGTEFKFDRTDYRIKRLRERNFK